MSNYEYANGAGLSVLSQKIFEHLSADLDLKADKATTYTKTEVDNFVDTDVVTSEATNPITIETDAAQYAKNTHLTLEPVQDLHGYDHPWPEGGGKNKLQYPFVSTNVSGTGVTFTVRDDGTVVANGTAPSDSNCQISIRLQDSLSGRYRFTGISVPQSGVDVYMWDETTGGRPKKYDRSTGVSSDNNGTLNEVYVEEGHMTRIVCRIAAGATVDNYVFHPMICVESETDVTYAPYSNICPITGVDEVEVKRTGFNQWDEEWELGRYNTTTGAKESDSTRIRCKNKIPIIPDATYYIKCGTTGGYVYVYAYDKSDNLINYWSRANQTQVFPSNTAYITISPTQDYGAVYNHDICINISDASKNGTYEPYTGYTASLDLPEPVYSGTLDLETGELVVDRAFWSKNTSTMDNDENYPGWKNSGIRNLIGGGLNNRVHNQLLNIGQVFSVNTTASYDILYFTTADYNKTQSEWIALAQDVQIVVSLATPITYQLTPQQLALFKGINNISTNAKTVQVTYREGSLATLEELNAISFDLSNVKSKLPPIIIKDGMLQVTYDDGQ